MKYAGIGSRETPGPVLNQMTHIAAQLAIARVPAILRSGGARGADDAFDRGVRIASSNAREIFTAPMAERHPAWFDHARRYHPAWSKCSDHAKALHARNSAIMLGATLNDPVDLVICWTKDGGASGGTGQALRIAHDLSIPVFNLFYQTAALVLKEHLANRGYKI